MLGVTADGKVVEMDLLQSYLEANYGKRKVFAIDSDVTLIADSTTRTYDLVDSAGIDLNFISWDLTFNSISGSLISIKDVYNLRNSDVQQLSGKIILRTTNNRSNDYTIPQGAKLILYY